MSWYLWAIPIAWAAFLIWRGLRRRPPATYAPRPPVVDTVRGMADRTRSDRLTAPFDWDNDDGPDAA